MGKTRSDMAGVAQSNGDMAGARHEHGWGVVEYPDGMPILNKEAWAAYHGEHFRKAAARVYSRIVLAHVRKATVGAPDIDNTHPFLFGHWAFAHNGTVPNFDAVRELMLDNMDPLHRNEIHGTTDSEHVFHYLLGMWRQTPERPLVGILRDGLGRVVSYCRAVDPDARIGLNVLWTDGTHLVGSRYGRTLWYLERKGPHICEFCGKNHIHHGSADGYRAVEVASEPISQDEEWMEMPNGTFYTVDPDMCIHFYPFEAALKGG